MAGSRKKQTLKDVARHAGVSISSVSRVLNNVKPVSEELRNQVFAAVKATGYTCKRPSPVYRGSVVILIPDSYNPYFLEIIRGMEDQALRYGFVINIVVVLENPDYKESLLRWLAKSSCEGVVLCSSSGGITDSDLVRLHETHGLPIVLVNRKAPSPQFPLIKIDFADAMYRAMKHLLDLGHRRIAYLGGPESSQSANEKRKGIERALSETGFMIRPEMYLFGLPTVEWGFHGACTLLDLPLERRPTAIIAFNDLTALGALHAIRFRKLHVPSDISVIGFDDIAMAAHANPPLTTIAPPKYEMGILAMQILNQIRENAPSQAGQFNLFDSPLVIRESTAPCREL